MSGFSDPGPMGPLAGAMGGGSLVRDWLGRPLAADPGDSRGGAAPLFTSAWAGSQAGGAGPALPKQQAERLRANLGLLASGRASVVVTGQQPGFLGGPLYTLLKIATTIALAEDLSRPGHPVLPVFWSGDDDTDLNEALAAVGWDPRHGQLLRSEGRPLLRAATYRRRRVGTLESKLFSGRAAGWLEVAGRSGDALSADLASLWARAVAENWRWDRLARTAWLACFAGTDLIVLSGDDPLLHEAAAVFTADCRGRTDEFARLAGDRGRQLERDGGHAQLDERSLRRQWYRTEGDRRLPVAPADAADVPADSLRPGVVMRSLVQDWLLQPAAVVVGPSEFAYLRQLEPVYRACGVRRSPLVPRLSGWLLPPSLGSVDPEEFRRQNRDPRLTAEPVAQEVLAVAARKLEDALVASAGLDRDRARQLAERRTGRWRRGVRDLVAGQIRAGGPGARGPGPGWVHLAGERQERSLASFAALGLWGADLRAAVLEAARLHLQAGRRGHWSEFRIDVPDPSTEGGRES